MTDVTPRDRVVGLYSFPKSGNTWLRAIIAGITGMPGGPGMLQKYITDSHFGPVIENPWEFQGQNWYFYKSHHKQVLTESHDQNFDTDQILYIYRHPLDIFVSYLNFASRNVGAPVGGELPVQFDSVEDLTGQEMETLFSIFLEHATLFPRNKAFGNVFEHVRRFRDLQAAGTIPVHILRYEDLSDDFTAEAGAICEFLGIENADLAGVFDIADQRTRQDGKFFWKRRKDNYRDYLSEDQIARFYGAHREDMAALGYGEYTPPAGTAIYVITRDQHRAAHARLAVERLSALAKTLIVVTEAGEEAAVRAALADSRVDRIVSVSKPVTSPLAGYREALLALDRKEAAAAGPVIMTSTDAFGPFGDIGAGVAGMAAADVDLLAPYWNAPALDPRFKTRKLPERIASLDLAVFAPSLLADDGFWDFWTACRATGDPWRDFLAGPAGFSVWMEKAGHVTGYTIAKDRLETADPRHSEIHKLVEDKTLCLPVSVFTLDPVLHDLGAIYLRAALDRLRGADPELYAAVIDFVTKRVQMRDFNTIADQYEVLSGTAADPEKRHWSFGRVAVFIHAFYADMMPEFWELTRRLPCETHLFLTTASEADKAGIEGFLAGKGLNADAFTVRVVEQNRGRDMSSLFITWRDVVLEGSFEVALRLHSKRTPQVSRQVGDSFKDHLFENLVASPGYVANLLDRLEAEPDIGLVIPPVIQIGFGTLGHSWFNNRRAVQDLIRDMGLEVPLDEHTPVAPNGTMYWFRTDALAPMFAYPWRWQDYNAEPHHIDGGLAHVQERLIGYAVQGQGYRVYTVMTPGSAARYYARLEYKLQRLAAHLATGNIAHQLAQLEASQNRLRNRLFRGLQGLYGKVLIRYPALRGPLRPLKNLAISVLSPGRRS